MAGVIAQEHDVLNGRVWSMWHECGIQFRSNLLLHKGACVPLHAHSYDHIAMLTAGEFDVTVDDQAPYVAVAPCRIMIPAGSEHTFSLRSDTGEVLCMWGEK